MKITFWMCICLSVVFAQGLADGSSTTTEDGGDTTTTTDPGDGGNTTITVDPGDGGNTTTTVDAGDGGNTTTTVDPGDGGNTTTTVDPGDGGNTTTTVGPEDGGNITTTIDLGDGGNTTTTVDPGDGSNTTTTVDPGDGGNTTTTVGPGDGGNITTTVDPEDGGNTTTTVDPGDSGNTTTTVDPGDGGNTTTTVDPGDGGNTTTTVDPGDNTTSLDFSTGGGDITKTSSEIALTTTSISLETSPTSMIIPHSTQTRRTTRVARTTTPPPVTRVPPTENRIISLQFEIRYQNTTLNEGSMFSVTTVEDPQKNLQDNLTELYQNKTHGFSSLKVTGMPNETYNQATYRVEYQSAALTSDCASTSGCQLIRQIQDRVIHLIPEYGRLPGRLVDKEATETAMNVTLQKESQRLENPCLMNKHVCANPGHTETCIFNRTTKAYWCVDVCRQMLSFCSGGTCIAYDEQNNGYNGVRTCRCPPNLQLNSQGDACLGGRCERFHFLSSNDQCVSWWAVLGPLIGVTIIAFLLVFIVVVLIRKKPVKNKELPAIESYQETLQKYSSEQTKDTAQDVRDSEPLLTFMPPVDTAPKQSQEVAKDTMEIEDEKKRLATTTPPATGEQPGETHLSQSAEQTHPMKPAEETRPNKTAEETRFHKPDPVRQQDLQDFVTLTKADDIAKHPQFRDFSPQLDKVDTSKLIKIPRIGGRPRSYEENLGGAPPRSSMYAYDNPTYDDRGRL